MWGDWTLIGHWKVCFPCRTAAFQETSASQPGLCSSGKSPCQLSQSTKTVGPEHFICEQKRGSWCIVTFVSGYEELNQTQEKLHAGSICTVYVQEPGGYHLQCTYVDLRPAPTLSSFLSDSFPRSQICKNLGPRVQNLPLDRNTGRKS